MQDVPEKSVWEVVVVGAGLSGLAVAERLHASGRRVVVLEKSRGAGGRVASRDFHGRAFDYGAATLEGTIPSLPTEGLRTAVQRRFAGVLSHVLAHEKVVDLVQGREGGVTVATEGGHEFSARHVVLALPAPQALALARGLVDARALETVTYESAAVVVLSTTNPQGREAAWRTDFVIDEDTYLSADERTWRELAERRFAEEASGAAAPPIREAFVKRWRYSRPTSRITGRHLAFEDAGVWLVGDYFEGPEGPIRTAQGSADSCAQALIQCLRGEP